MEKNFEHVNTKTILIRNFVKLGHENDYLAIWKQETGVRQRHGFRFLNAFMETGSGMKYNLTDNEYSETGDERVFTCLYSYDGDLDSGILNVTNDIGMLALSREKEAHTVKDGSLRIVTQQIMNPVSAVSLEKMVIMRRYNVKNDWNEFLDIWRKIVPVREKYGFPCLFAVEDVEERVFTWAFTYDGDDFDTFISEGQADYYSDPRRVELESINNYLDAIRLTPARQVSI